MHLFNRNARYTHLIASFFIITTFMSFIKIYNLRANTFDLGQYTSFLSQLKHEDFFQILLSTHVQPFLLLFSYLAVNSYIDYSLVLFQSVAVALGGLILTRGCPDDCRFPAALVYVFSLAAWFSVLNDFHLEHLLFPLIIGFMALLANARADRWPIFVVLAACICAVKEPYALTSAALGFLMALRGRSLRVPGIAIAAGSLIYFAIATGYLIPVNTDDRQVGALWSRGFGYLGQSPVDMIVTMLRNPFSVAMQAFSWRKLVFFGALIGPFVYLLWRVPLALLPALPTLAIVSLSADPNHSYLGHHYPVSVTATLMGALVLAMGQEEDRNKRRNMLYFSAAASFVALVLFGPAPVSRLFWSGHAYAYQWQAYVPTQRSAEIRQLIDRHVPADRRTAISVQNTIHSERIAARPFIFAFPGGVVSPERVLSGVAVQVLGDTAAAKQGRLLADMVIIDRKRPLSHLDEVCAWNANSICDDQAFRARFDAAMAALDSSFDLVESYDTFAIYRRKK
jgi:uncharacterized membrane protein